MAGEPLDKLKTFYNTVPTARRIWIKNKFIYLLKV
jgi:hypothetical protein